MTDITLEQRARLMFAGHLRANGYACGAEAIELGRHSPYDRAALGAIAEALEAALRLSAGADWALVPREPTPEMLGAFYRMATGADWCPSACNLTKRQLARARKAYAAMIDAATRHETGEGL